VDAVVLQWFAVEDLAREARLETTAAVTWEIRKRSMRSLASLLKKLIIRQS
jgi:hypothetical protein